MSYKFNPCPCSVGKPRENENLFLRGLPCAGPKGKSDTHRPCPGMCWLKKRDARRHKANCSCLTRSKAFPAPCGGIPPRPCIPPPTKPKKRQVRQTCVEINVSPPAESYTWPRKLTLDEYAYECTGDVNKLTDEVQDLLDEVKIVDRIANKDRYECSGNPVAVRDMLKELMDEVKEVQKICTDQTGYDFNQCTCKTPRY